MEDGKSLLTLFEENGFVIKNVTTFAKESESIDLKELIEKLVGLEKQMTSSIDVTDFSRDIKVELDKLKNIFNSSEIYLKSSIRESFEEKLKAVEQNFSFIQNYIKAEEIMLFQKQNMYDAMRQIYELEKKKDLSDLERTSETLRLLGNKKKCENAYRDALSFYNEQKAIYETNMKEFNLTDYKNDLLQTINEVDDEIRRNDTFASLQEKARPILSGIREKIALFGLESLKSKSEFESLCKKYGLESTKVKVASKPRNEEKSEIKPEVKPEEKSQIDETQNRLDLYNAIAVRNPGSKVKLDGDKLIVNGSVNDLVLPEGFKYTEGLGINNKKNDTDSYISFKVEERKPVREQPEVVIPPKPTTIPSGKAEVKGVKKAIMNSYVASILQGIGVCSLGAVVLGVGIVPMALAGGILSGVFQTVSMRLAQNGASPKYNTGFYNDHPEAAMWSVATIRAMEGKAKNLLEAYKEAKKAKNMAASKPQEVVSNESLNKQEEPELNETANEVNYSDFQQEIQQKIEETYNAKKVEKEIHDDETLIESSKESEPSYEELMARVEHILGDNQEEMIPDQEESLGGR